VSSTGEVIINATVLILVDLNADMNIVGYFCNANFNNFDNTENNANIQPEAKSDSNKQSEVITSSPNNS
jgi:hypothetical protein